MTTPDVFISYARDDASMARRFADGLEAAGLSVWWDDALRSGEVFDQAIEKALRSAKAVVVLWSPSSVNSRWVRAEATLADRQGTLVPAIIAPCERPIIFEMVQTSDLSAWHGEGSHAGWQAFIAEVRNRLGGKAEAEPAPKASRAEAAADRIAIVVLPFTNMGGDPEQDYFADGITEDVITDLSKVSALSVISRNSAFTFKGKHVDVPAVARQLNVTHVLEGSVRKAGNRVRVTAQLIDGSSNEHVWAERWDRDLDDIFELQDELSQAIVDALKIKLVPAEKKAISDRGTENLEAYDLFLRGRALSNRLGGEPLARAAELLRRAIAADPTFLPAYGMLAVALTHQITLRPESGEANWVELESLERRVREVDPGHPAALTIRATLLGSTGDFIGARKALDALPEDYRDGSNWCAPGLNEAHFGYFEKALEAAREAIRNDPLNFILSFLLRDLLDITGRLDEAQAESNRSRDIPGDRGYVELVALTRMKGRASSGEMARQYQRFLAARGPEMQLPLFEKLAGVLEQPEMALSLVRATMDDPAYQDPTRLIWFALLAAFFDAPEDALHLLRRAYVDKRPEWDLRVYLWLPVLRETRRLAGFKDILRDIGLVDFWRTTGNWGDFTRPLGEDDFEVLG